MTPEERDMLVKTYALSQENNRILQKMDKSGRTSRIVKYFYWAFIVIATVGSIYFGSLYVNSINSAVDFGDTTTPNAPAVAATSSSGVVNYLNNLKTELQQISQ